MTSSHLVLESKYKIDFHVKLYCWSLVAEPLMFFVLTDVHQTGSALTLSRLLQIWAGLYFVAHVIKNGISIPSPSFRYYKLYWIYILVGLASTLMGVIYFGSYTLINSPADDHGGLLLVQFLRGTHTRPFIEVGLTLYYFVYFFVLPKYLIKTSPQLRYLLDLTVKVFKVVVVIGLIDVVQYIFTGVNFVPRHLVDSRFIELGTRFHGFAGEPRDAFPYLIFGLTVYYLRAAIFSQIATSKYLVYFTVLALFLTQSASGLIGIVIAASIYIVVDMRFSIARIAKILLTLVVGGTILFLVVTETDRLKEYVDAADGLSEVLKSGDELHPRLFSQSSNIFPVWQVFIYLSEYNVLPVVFGSGFGSASFVNNNLGGMAELVNPQSNFIRLIYEVGFLGLFFYVTSQLLPMQHLKSLIGDDKGRLIYLLTILLIGSCLGHRSTTIFIFCGIVVAIISIKRNSSNV